MEHIEHDYEDPLTKQDRRKKNKIVIHIHWFLSGALTVIGPIVPVGAAVI